MEKNWYFGCLQIFKISTPVEALCMWIGQICRQPNGESSTLWWRKKMPFWFNSPPHIWHDETKELFSQSLIKTFASTFIKACSHTETVQKHFQSVQILIIAHSFWMYFLNLLRSASKRMEYDPILGKIVLLQRATELKTLKLSFKRSVSPEWLLQHVGVHRFLMANDDRNNRKNNTQHNSKWNNSNDSISWRKCEECLLVISFYLAADRRGFEGVCRLWQ